MIPWKEWWETVALDGTVLKGVQWVTEELDDLIVLWAGMPIGIDGMEDPTPDLFDVTWAARGTGAPIIGLLEASLVVIAVVQDDLVEESNVQDELEATPLEVGFRWPAVMNRCLSTFRGFRRCSGSQHKHLTMKSMKCSLSHCKTCANLPEQQCRPQELTTRHGAPVRSKG